MDRYSTGTEQVHHKLAFSSWAQLPCVVSQGVHYLRSFCNLVGNHVDLRTNQLTAALAILIQHPRSTPLHNIIEAVKD